MKSIIKLKNIILIFTLSFIGIAQMFGDTTKEEISNPSINVNKDNVKIIKAVLMGATAGIVGNVICGPYCATIGIGIGVNYDKLSEKSYKAMSKMKWPVIIGSLMELRNGVNGENVIIGGVKGAFITTFCIIVEDQIEYLTDQIEYLIDYSGNTTIDRELIKAGIEGLVKTRMGYLDPTQSNLLKNIKAFLLGVPKSISTKKLMSHYNRHKENQESTAHFIIAEQYPSIILKWYLYVLSNLNSESLNCELNEFDSEGETPIIMAFRRNRYDYIAILVNYEEQLIPDRIKKILGLDDNSNFCLSIINSFEFE